MLSDDYMYSPDELRRPSNSTVSSEGTISPKDSYYLSSDLPDAMPYYAFDNSPPSYQNTPGPIAPVSPRTPPRPTPRGIHIDAKSKGGPASQQTGAAISTPSTANTTTTTTRRRSAKAPSTSPSSSNASKSAGVSNNNNSKPMTARDRKRRQMHNASAMRSRIRLNETLDKMWRTIPAPRRRKRLLSVNTDGSFDGDEQMDDVEDEDEERIGRADKVEVGIDYIVYLEERVKELEDRVSQHQ
jgi:hypothetical protein